MAESFLDKKIAGVGTKWWLLGGVTTVGVVWYVMKRQSTSGGTETPTDSTIDPATGLPYGQSDYSSAEYQYPQSAGYYDAYGNLITGAGAVSTVTQPTTNAQWMQQVVGILTTNGFDPITAAAAVGAYLNNKTLSNEQMAIVQAAIGFMGYPPQSPGVPKAAPPVGQKPKPSIVPKGTRIGTFVTTSQVHTAPDLVKRLHTTYPVLYGLNPRLLTYNLHNLPVGLKVWYPTTSTKGTFVYNGTQTL